MGRGHIGTSTLYFVNRECKVFQHGGSRVASFVSSHGRSRLYIVLVELGKYKQERKMGVYDRQYFIVFCFIFLCCRKIYENVAGGKWR